MNMRYQSLLLSISILILLNTCTKNKYVEVIKEIPVDSLIIFVKKDDTGYFGASGIVNGNEKEYQGDEYAFYYQDNEEYFGIQIASFEWVGNVIWAHREIITLSSLDLTMIGDTIVLESLENFSNDKPFAHIYHAYLDGDAVAECYKILDFENSKSWLLLTEYDEQVGYLAGTIHADYVISDVCPPKYDPSQPDTIRVRDFWFRAKLRE